MEERTTHIPAVARRPIQRGADDQSAAFKEFLARLAAMDAAADDQQWETVKRGLQETRRAQGQRLLFPE